MGPGGASAPPVSMLTDALALMQILDSFVLVKANKHKIIGDREIGTNEGNQ